MNTELVKTRYLLISHAVSGQSPALAGWR